MIFGSICSGIEAASAAWLPLGWSCAFMSEIEAFPRAVLGYHYPETALHGDFTTIRTGEYDAIDVMVGGTPCQSFSVAGLRGGLANERGNLALEYLRLAERLRPRWLVWENVPGVLSSGAGRDFGAFVGRLAELGYGWAYRVLDAQYFGLAQRRKRVFVVGYLGDWRRAAAVLFEPASLRWHPAPSRAKGKGFTHPVAQSLGASGRGYERAGETRGQDSIVAMSLNAHGGSGRMDGESETFIASIGLGSDPLWSDDLAQPCTNRNGDPGVVAHSLRADGFDASEDGTGRGTPLVAAFQTSAMANGFAWERDISPALERHPQSDTSNRQQGVRIGSAVRRLTPRECERLQGFPDDYTLIPYRGKPASDGPRYRALGNSMAVPVMAWIGKRIANTDLRAAA